MTRRGAAAAPGTCMVDTSCWMEWHRRTRTGAEIQNFLEGRTCLTPSPVIGELRNLCNDGFYRIKSLVISNSTAVNCDDRISEQAGLLKKKGRVRKMGWVDYVVLASAIVKDAAVCTTDHHFDSYRGIVDAKLFAKP